MKSSSEGRLGLKSKPFYNWKGRTFSQISSVIQKNKGLETSIPSQYFRALPLKIYRRELARTVTSGSSKSQTIRTVMETPGSTIVNGECTNCHGEQNTLDINYNENKSENPCSTCDESLTKGLPEYQNSNYIQSLSQASLE